MKKNIINLLFVFLSFAVFAMPFQVYSQGVVSGLTYECVSGTGANAVYGNCTFNDLVAATRNVVNKLTILAIGFSVIVIAFAGFKYLTSEGSPGAIADANRMFRSVAIGIAFIIGAWAIVNLIASGLGVTSFTFSTQ